MDLLLELMPKHDRMITLLSKYSRAWDAKYRMNYVDNVKNSISSMAKRYENDTELKFKDFDSKLFDNSNMGFVGIIDVDSPKVQEAISEGAIRNTEAQIRNNNLLRDSLKEQHLRIFGREIKD